MPSENWLDQRLKSKTTLHRAWSRYSFTTAMVLEMEESTCMKELQIEGEGLN